MCNLTVITTIWYYASIIAHMLIFVKYYTLFCEFLAWYNRGMIKKNLAADFAIRHDDPEDFKHSSQYAKAQSGDNFGSASLVSFEARKALDQSRKYVGGYKSSQIGARRYSGLKPEVYKAEVGPAEVNKPGQSGSSLRYSGPATALTRKSSLRARLPGTPRVSPE